MATIISCSIDLRKIDKSKIVVGEKGGKYYNFDIVVNDEKDKFGNDVSISDKQTKEQREAKEKKNYLGNGRVVWQGESKKKETKKEEFRVEDDQNGDSLPF